MIEAFPKPVSEVRPIPSEIWPDLAGVEKAKVITLKPTLAEWRRFWKDAVHFPIVSVDTETDGLHPFHGNQIVGVSAAYFNGKEIIAGYWNFRHRGHGPHKFCQMEHAKNPKSPARKKCPNCKRDAKTGGCKGYKEKQKPLPVKAFADVIPVYENCIVSGQNFKFDARHGSREGLPVPRRILDTQIIAHLFNERKKRYNLIVLGEEMGEKKQTDAIEGYAEEHAIKIKETGHAEIAFYVEQPYAVMDTVIVLRRLQWERRRWLELKDPKLMGTFQIEMASIPAFAQMEINGYKLDMPYVKKGVKVLEEEVAALEKIVYKHAKKKFDIASGQALWGILEEAGHEPIGFGRDGVPIVDEDALNRYGTPLTMAVIKYRKKAKILSTYLGPFLKTHATTDGFLHADNFIYGTRTGRPSQRDPNLANQPRVDDDAPPDTVEVRRCFIPREPGRVLVFLDYNQMEMRALFDYIRDLKMIEAMNNGADSHAATAKNVFNDCPEDTDPRFKRFRQDAKTINFGIVYGMGREKLAGRLGIQIDEPMRGLKMALALYAKGEFLGKWAYELFSKHVHATPKELEAMATDFRTNWAARHWDALRRVQGRIAAAVDLRALDKVVFEHGLDPSFKRSAKTVLDQYHEKIPGVKPMTGKIKKALKTRGFIFNRFGRRYHIDTDKAYIGVNYLVQGTCGDVMKRAQHRANEILRGSNSFAVNAVYDDLQLDMDRKDLQLVPSIKEAMEHNPEFDVKLEVDVEYSFKSWADKKKWVSVQATLEDFRDGIKNKSRSEKAVRKTKAMAKGKSLARSPKKSLRKMQQPKSKRIRKLGRARNKVSANNR